LSWPTGTIFLDEVANLSYDIQISLLRVVQERKMRRVGGIKDIELDVRIIIASNERLWDAVRRGKFREDLYHRFNEFSIDVPPLRQRPDDVMLFANHFLHQTNGSWEKISAASVPMNREYFPDLRMVWQPERTEERDQARHAAFGRRRDRSELTAFRDLSLQQAAV
jgi:transcriptional regulator with GAF, ATPase, and Fis domain